MTPAGRNATLLARLEERFLVPSVVSPRAPLWIAGRRTLAAPVQLRGRVRHYVDRQEGHEIHIACVGREKRFASLLQRWFRSPLVEESGPVRWLAGRDALARLDAELVAVELHPWMVAPFRRAGWLIVPELVRWVARTADVPPPRLSKSLRSDLAKVTKYGYTLEAADRPDDWAEFYDEMVIPQARSRFGGEAWIPSALLRRQIARRGLLHFVRRDGVRVAGISLVPNGHMVWYPVSGLRGGDPQLLREGAMAAVYALSFAWTRARGFERLDLGRTTPFLRDGVQAVKRKWGFQPVMDPLAHVIALRADLSYDPLRSAIDREPVLVETGAGLGVFAGSGIEAEP